MPNRVYDRILFLLLLLLPLPLFLASLMIGPAGIISPWKILGGVIHGEGLLEGIARYRILRSLAAVIIGAGLGASGLTYQYTLENPLADPYLLGISTGAAFGVVTSLVLGLGDEPVIVYILSLGMGLIAFMLVAGIGYYTGGSPAGLVVAGVSVSYGFFGLIVMEMALNEKARLLGYTWLFGTVAYPLPRLLVYTGGLTLVGVIILFLLGERLYTLILGEKVSASLGADPGKTRLLGLAAASIIAAATVALAGPVGFIGLAAPWASRLLLGSRFRLVLASSLAVGAGSALASDMVVRVFTMTGAGEIPLTAVTALFGGPILYYLARRTGW